MNCGRYKTETLKSGISTKSGLTREYILHNFASKRGRANEQRF